ncbi:MAG: sensory box histidine kinase [Crocinitomicaceae bacterium]|jgi:PAS domain-containing protein|nr:sensory box histidine kinase [Crocinitomicaceae bacterium]
MKPLAYTLIAIQDIANNFEGSFALKNAQGKYFYANDCWLKTLKREHGQLIGKTDNELFLPEHAAFLKKTDQQAFESNGLLQYTNTLSIEGKEITYLALKWVIRHKTGDIFCYCTMGDLVEKQESVLAMQSRIREILEKAEDRAHA